MTVDPLAVRDLTTAGAGGAWGTLGVLGAAAASACICNVFEISANTFSCLVYAEACAYASRATVQSLKVQTDLLNALTACL